MVGQTTVGAASTEVVPRNPARNVLYLCNDSTYDIYLAINEPAVMGQGIVLPAGQGITPFPFSFKDGDVGLRERINAICDPGDMNLAWLEM